MFHQIVFSIYIFIYFIIYFIYIFIHFLFLSYSDIIGDSVCTLYRNVPDPVDKIQVVCEICR